VNLIDRLRRNAELNGFDIAVVEAAVWDENGTVELVAYASTKEAHVVPAEGVASVTIDELARRYGPPMIIKLDVEGADARALEGARHVLSGSRSIVVLELHGSAQRERVPELFGTDGYVIEELDSRDRIVARPAVGSAE
jgi:FkbM family methyltransferase